MIVTLQTRRLRSIGQVRSFVEGNGSVDYEHRDRKSAYAFVGDRLRRFGCKGLGKRDKGTVRRFLAKTTGLSEAQVDRLIRQWRETGRIEDRRGGGRGRPFERRYTAAAAVGRSSAATRRRTSGCWPTWTSSVQKGSGHGVEHVSLSPSEARYFFHSRTHTTLAVPDMPGGATPLWYGCQPRNAVIRGRRVSACPGGTLVDQFAVARRV